MPTKTKFLIIFLIVLIIILILVRVFRKPEGKESSVLPVIQQTIQSSAFRIISSVPTEKIFSVIEPITLIFSQPIKESTIFINTSPEADVLTTFNNSKTILTIEPKQAWRYGTTYTVTVSKGARSMDGTLLEQDYNFNFKTEAYYGI